MILSNLWIQYIYFHFTVENLPVIFTKKNVQDGHLELQDGRHRYNFEKVSIEFLDLQNIYLYIKIMFYDIYKLRYR